MASSLVIVRFYGEFRISQETNTLTTKPLCNKSAHGPQGIFKQGRQVKITQEDQGNSRQSAESTSRQESKIRSQMKPPYDVRGRSGVYCIIHRDSGMCYVGSSVNMSNRIKSHLSAARTGRKTCISRAIREFGEGAFDFEVLLECPKEQLLERERFYIVLMNAASLEGFNTMSKPIANYDVFPNEVTRARISAACKGRVFSKEHKAKIGSSQKGKVISAECREKIRASLTGRKLPPVRIAQMRITGTGRKLSAEACEKVRLSKLGLSPSVETRAKISKSLSLTAARGDNNASRLYPERRPRGNNHPNSKLNEAAVREIRATYESGEVSESELGAIFGVSQVSINRVLSGQTWSHVT